MKCLQPVGKQQELLSIVHKSETAGELLDIHKQFDQKQTEKLHAAKQYKQKLSGEYAELFAEMALQQQLREKASNCAMAAEEQCQRVAEQHAAAVAECEKLEQLASLLESEQKQVHCK